MKSGDIYIKKFDNVLMLEIGIFGLEENGSTPITFLTVHALTNGVESLKTGVQTREYQDEYFNDSKVIANVYNWLVEMKEKEKTDSENFDRISKLTDMIESRES